MLSLYIYLHGVTFKMRYNPEKILIYGEKLHAQLPNT